MPSARSRRVARLAATLATCRRAGRAPFQLVVDTLNGQSRDDARAAFDARYGVDPNRRLLIVPKKPTDAAERTTYAARFKAQQMKIVSEARRSNAAVAAAEPTFAPNAVWSAPRAPKHSPKPWRPDAKR